MDVEYGEMVCSECDENEEITDHTEMPPLYCPECGGRRTVERDHTEPEETKTDRV